MSKTGNTYTEEFRRDAVELLQSSARPISQVAREMGVNVNSLRTWRDRILGQSAGETLGAVGDKGRGERRPRICGLRSRISKRRTSISGASAKS